MYGNSKIYYREFMGNCISYFNRDWISPNI